LFLAAGVGGYVLIFRELARLLGDEQPVFGLQGIGLDGKEAPVCDMEQIARRYIQEIVSIQPQGPYYLSGWSMGGVIAYEIARQMLADGRELGALIVLDAYAPWALSFGQRVRLHLDSIRKRSWRSRLRYVWQRLTHQCEVMARRLGYDRPAEGLTGPTADRVRDSSLAQFEAFRRYRPKPFPGNLVLLRAEQTAEIRDPRADDPQLGWGVLVEGSVEVLPIRGSHTGIFVGQNVEHVAAALNRALAMRMPSPKAPAAESPTPRPDTSQDVSGKSVAQSLG
jgi:thioesterase domain-containing protein